jgi:preprotein translocase subunit Sec63
MDRERFRRSAGAGVVFVIVGLLVSQASELNSLLSKAFDPVLYVISALILMIVTWGMITAVVYQIQSVTPAERVRLEPEEISRIAEDLRNQSAPDETQESDPEFDVE